MSSLSGSCNPKTAPNNFTGVIIGVVVAVVVVLTVMLVITCVLYRRSNKRENLADTDQNSSRIDAQSNQRTHSGNCEEQSEYAELNVIRRVSDASNYQHLITVREQMEHGKNLYENVSQRSSFNRATSNPYEEHFH
jgi:mannitol-specific phosphotransferase system IIBC component